MILAVWRGLGATAPLVAEMAVTVQPSRAATSCKGASWFDWPRSLVLTRTYSAARLVAWPGRPSRSRDTATADQSHQTNNSQVRRPL
jgi:hypothetical protein